MRKYTLNVKRLSRSALLNLWHDHALVNTAFNAGWLGFPYVYMRCDSKGEIKDPNTATVYTIKELHERVANGTNVNVI